MIHLKKKIIAVSLLGTTILASVNAFSIDNGGESITLTKGIPGIACTNTKFIYYGKDITECEIERENIDPEELYSNLIKSQRAVVNCMKPVESDGQEHSEAKCKAVIAGVSCTKYYYMVFGFVFGNERKPIECDIDEETIDPDQLYAALTDYYLFGGGVSLYYQKDCYNSRGQIVNCLEENGTVF